MSPQPDLTSLWQRLCSMFARAADIIGKPETLARVEALTHKRRHEIACWLARIECIARKLLFAEAATLTVEPDKPQATTRAAMPRSRARKAIDPTQPHTWPARFRLAPPRDPCAVPESRAPRIRALWGSTPPTPAPTNRAPAQATPAPLHLAIRAEALRRVLENPHPHARRLARLFHRLKRRFPEATSRYAIAAARPHAADPGDPRLIVDALVIAITAAELFANTS